MKRRSQQTAETPIASLIDVVFLLIIFFVVTASVEQDVVDQSITLAQAKYAQPATKKNPLTVTINVTKDGDINIAKMPVSMRELEQILTGTFKDVGRKAPILIRADADTPYRYVSRVQDVIKRSGFYRVRLAAVTKQ